MTTTHPDLAALTRAVCQFPDDDTPRLVLADCLDEHGQHERAELIRVQVEFERLRDVIRPGIEGPVFAEDFELVSEMARDWSRKMKLARRERELLTDARRREWGGIPCPNCGSPMPLAMRIDCPVCDETRFAPVEFRRGFVDRVTCRMRDVLEYGQFLSQWARGVLAAHPVTRWEIVDREPWEQLGRFVWWSWIDGEYQHELPAPVAEDLFYSQGGLGAGTRNSYFRTSEQARDALALAVGRVARRLAGLEVTP